MSGRHPTSSPLLGGLACFWLVACGGAAVQQEHEAATSYQSIRGEGLGTTWTVQWGGEASEAAVEQAVVGALSEVDQAMSTWRDDSDLARIRAVQEPVAVRWETAHVVRQALALAEQTHGAFDPTVQPLVELWGFHGDPPEEIPSDEQIAAVMDGVGWQKVQVAANTVDASGTALDLSAIAKGWAVDRVAWAVAAEGATNFMVEIGGETTVAGHGPRGPWTVGIERPVEGSTPGRSLYGALRPIHGAVATSGNYRSRVVIGDRSFGHTLDPRTGRPTEHAVLSATVLAPDCLTADGWATALMVMGTEGLDLVEARPGMEALILAGDPESPTAYPSSGFEAFLVP